MIVKNKKVYYCDYCSKHGMRGPDIKKHEEHCTLNPKRTCRLCGRKEGIDEIAKKYIKYGRIEQIVGEVDIDKLMDSVQYCPACTLAVIRCAKLHNIEFDYQKELAKWWSDKNTEEYTSQNYN